MVQEMSTHKRHAKALRGRFGCDVWERWLEAGEDRQLEWLASKDAAIDPEGVRTELIEILNAEGISYPDCTP